MAAVLGDGLLRGSITPPPLLLTCLLLLDFPFFNAGSVACLWILALLSATSRTRIGGGEGRVPMTISEALVSKMKIIELLRLEGLGIV